MRIVTWNINGLRARLDRLLPWLERQAPDVLCLQETKVPDADSPVEALRDAGYHAYLWGQKTYNGVALLSRNPAREVRQGLGDDDPQCRLIEGEFDGVRVLSAYFPNGRAVGSAEFAYKLDWMGRLADHLERTARPDQPLVLAGDFNVAPDDRDVALPDQWALSVLCHPSVRGALERLRDWGLVDVFRQQHPDGGIYSWWDYRMLAFPRNNGLRIDHVFATRPLAERCRAATVDREERKQGTIGKPSDHAPVVVDFA